MFLESWKNSANVLAMSCFACMLYTGVQKFAYFLELFQELSWERKNFTLSLAGNNCSQERSWEIHFQGGNTVPGTFLGTFPGMFLGNVSHFSTSFVGNSFSQEKWEYSWEIFQSGKYCSHFSRNVPGKFLECSWEMFLFRFLGIIFPIFPRKLGTVPGTVFPRNLPTIPRNFPGTFPGTVPRNNS